MIWLDFECKKTKYSQSLHLFSWGKRSIISKWSKYAVWVFFRKKERERELASFVEDTAQRKDKWYKWEFVKKQEKKNRLRGNGKWQAKFVSHYEFGQTTLRRCGIGFFLVLLYYYYCCFFLLSLCETSFTVCMCHFLSIRINQQKKTTNHLLCSVVQRAHTPGTPGVNAVQINVLLSPIATATVSPAQIASFFTMCLVSDDFGLLCSYGHHLLFQWTVANFLRLFGFSTRFFYAISHTQPQLQQKMQSVMWLLL